MIRAIIVEDEYLARERLKNLLSAHQDIEVVGEARKGTDGISLISDKSPDVLFLDVEMPDMNGFNVLENAQKIPIVIFTTAHKDFAIQAFEIRALDYLLKPFDEDRLNSSLELVRQEIEKRKSLQLAEGMQTLMKTYETSETSFRNQFEIKEKGFDYQIHVEDIYQIEAQGNYAKLFTMDRFFLFRTSMNDMEAELDPNRFLRIHRALIINKFWIDGHRYLGNNEFEIKLKNGRKLRSSRSYKDGIVKFLT